MTDADPDDPLVTVDEVTAARERLREAAHRTPLDDSETLARRSDAEALGLKLENLQKTGSYKIRGAYNCLARLSPADRERGVVAASGGNHAQGVAYAARELGIDATVVMPEAAPASKREATRSYGAEVVVHGDLYQACYEHALALVEREDRAFVPPFNHRDVIAGQGTIALEVLDQVDDWLDEADLAPRSTGPQVDTVLTAVGGGGCISGLGTVLTARSPDTRLVGVQTEGAGHMAPSLAAGEVRELEDVDTIAESIAASRTEEFTFRHVEARVDEVVEVTDEAVTAAMALLAERGKQVVEPAGALPVAAVLTDAVDVADERVVCNVSGGNLDLTEHAEWIRRGLVELDRYVTLRVAIADWPDGLGPLVEAVETAGGEVDEIEQAPPGRDARPNRQAVSLGVEVTDADHRERVAAAVRDGSDRDLLGVE